MTGTRRWIYLVPLLSSLLFIGLSWLLYQQAELKQPAHVDVDSKAYLASARMMYQDGSFAEIGYVPYYTLGYPLLISAIYKGFKQENTALIIITQIILSLLIGGIIFFFTKHIFGTTAAALSSLFFGCNLGFLVFSQFILTEITLAFFLLVAFCIFHCYLKTTHKKYLIITGILLGLSIIVKPAALYYPLVLMLFIKRPWRVWIVSVIMLISSFYLPIAAYQLHNRFTFSSWSIGSLNDVNLLFWFLPHVLAEQHGTSSDQERTALKQQEAEQGTSFIRSLLWQEITQHPSTVAYAWLKNTAKTIGGLYTANLKILVDPTVYSGQYSFFRMQGSYGERIKTYVWDSSSLLWVKLLGFGECCWNILRIILVLLSLCYLLLTKQWLLFFLFISYIAYFLLITGHDGCARFRMMIEAPLIILTALGCSLLIPHQRQSP